MSIPMINCVKCGNPMPANYEYCTNCGHTNAFVAPDSAVKPPVPRPVNGENQAETASAAAAGAGWQAGQNADPAQAGQPMPNLMPPPAYSPTPVQGSPTYSPSPGAYSIATTPRRDSMVALLLELIGYAGILGIGHIYAGRTTRGIWLLLGWLAYLAFGIYVIIVLSITLVGIPLACLMLLLYPFAPILSGIWIKRDLDRENAGYRP